MKDCTKVRWFNLNVRNFFILYKENLSRTYNSTGLGLYIEKQLICKMNGDIIAFTLGAYFGIKVTIRAAYKEYVNKT